MIPPELPGADFVAKGLADIAAGRTTQEAWLVKIGAPRLRSLGYDVAVTSPESPNEALYLMLAAEQPETAHARYNALVRRLVSFERAAELLQKHKR